MLKNQLNYTELNIILVLTDLQTTIFLFLKQRFLEKMQFILFFTALMGMANCLSNNKLLYKKPFQDKWTYK